MGWFDKWVSETTETSTSEANGAGHEARDDMEEEGLMPERSAAKNIETDTGKEIAENLIEKENNIRAVQTLIKKEDDKLD
mgnify:CR=1 FL=1